MSPTSWLYVIVFFIGVFSILIVMMGFDRVVKVIFGNYIITAMVIALGLFIDLEIKNIESNGVSFLGMGTTEIANFLQDGKLTIMLAIYCILMFVWYKFSSLQISIIQDETKKRGLMLLIAPLCVIGIMLSLLLIITGNNFTDLGRIFSIFPDNPEIRSIIMNTPLWIILHGIIILLLSIKIKISRKVETSFVSEYE